jgi:hypothetical protein
MSHSEEKDSVPNLIPITVNVPIPPKSHKDDQYDIDNDTFTDEEVEIEECEKTKDGFDSD